MLGINGNVFSRKTLDLGSSLTKGGIQSIDLLKLGNDNLKKSVFLSVPYLKNEDLINFRNFYLTYNFLEAVHFMKLGHKLQNKDIKKLYSSKLDQKLVFALDNFDKTSELPKPAQKFFIKLKKVKWKNKEIKRFYNKLNQKRKEFIYEDRIAEFLPNPTFLPPYRKTVIIRWALYFLTIGRFNPYENFIETENAFILFLAGCNTVNDDRTKINENDIIRAYKTYYKLLTTDISELVDRLWEEKYENKNNGYLVCKKCNNYYKLQPGESPDDFRGNCECGGKTNYYKNRDWLIKNES